MVQISIYDILILITAIIALVMGIFYLARKGYYYEKALEKMSDETIQKIAIAFVIISTALIVLFIIRIYY